MSTNTIVRKEILKLLAELRDEHGRNSLVALEDLAKELSMDSQELLHKHIVELVHQKYIDCSLDKLINITDQGIAHLQK